MLKCERVSNLGVIDCACLFRRYSAELNLDNPLGYAGRVAKGFGELMEVMHKAPGAGGGSLVSPRAFKRLIGEIRPQFAG